MDGIWLEDRGALERQVRDMMAHQVLPPEVVGYDVAFGDPAVWIHLYVPADTPPDWDKACALANLMAKTTGRLKHIVPHRLASTLLKRPPSERPASPLAHA